jgi:hypothetical protein
MHPARAFVAVAASTCTVLATFSGCDEAEPTEVAVADASFEDRILSIAATYLTYGLLDLQVTWGVESCVAPPPASVSLSTSDDETTHGRKLYYLFAADGYAYRLVDANAPASPVGQALVKESWEAEEVKTASLTTQLHACGQSVVPFATDVDKTYKAAKKQELFIMFKVDPGTAGTDNGWVYGTVTGDGKQVTSVGRVEKCMNCHQESRCDRLLGRGRASFHYNEKVEVP